MGPRVGLDVDGEPRQVSHQSAGWSPCGLRARRQYGVWRVDVTEWIETLLEAGTCMWERESVGILHHWLPLWSRNLHLSWMRSCWTTQPSSHLISPEDLVPSSQRPYRLSYSYPHPHNLVDQICRHCLLPPLFYRPNLPDKRNYTAINPLNAKLNPICPLLTLFGTHHILKVSNLRVNI